MLIPGEDTILLSHTDMLPERFRRFPPRLGVNPTGPKPETEVGSNPRLIKNYNPFRVL